VNAYIIHRTLLGFLSSNNNGDEPEPEPEEETGNGEEDIPGPPLFG
jgi:hypothetical protein